MRHEFPNMKSASQKMSFEVMHNVAARFRTLAPHFTSLHARPPHDDSSRQTRCLKRCPRKHNLHFTYVQLQATPDLTIAQPRPTTNAASHCQTAPQKQVKNIADFSTSSSPASSVSRPLIHCSQPSLCNARTLSKPCLPPLNAGPLILLYAKP